jgi:predicted nucleic acid-binding Zn ribbon protein
MSQPQELGNLLKEIISKYGLNEKLEQGIIFSEWNNWVSETVARNTTPVKIKRGVLYVKVTDDAWRSELSYQKIRLKELINGKIKREIIKDIKFI